MWFDTKMQIIKKMKVEIRQSINLLQKIFLISPKFIHEIDTDLFVNFLYNLECLLLKRFEGHWYPNQPERGSGFRSIKVDRYQIDPIIKTAAKKTNSEIILNYLPKELTIWIDPRQVYFRSNESGDVIPHFKSERNSSSIRTLWPTSNILQFFIGAFNSRETQKNKGVL